MQVSIGNYILVRPLGEGGMGTVYLAQHYHLRYYAVVKSLHPHYAQNEALRQRFFTEAQVMAQLSHPRCPLSRRRLPYPIPYMGGLTLPPQPKNHPSGYQAF
jgi:serine/threonine protein kinase